MNFDDVDSFTVGSMIVCVSKNVSFLSISRGHVTKPSRFIAKGEVALIIDNSCYEKPLPPDVQRLQFAVTAWITNSACYGVTG